MADAAPRVRVTLAVTRAVQLTDWRKRSKPEVTEVRDVLMEKMQFPVAAPTLKILNDCVRAQTAFFFFFLGIMASCTAEKNTHTLISLVSFTWEILTDCVHPPGLIDEELVFLLAQLVAQAECNAAAGQRGAPRTA